MSLFAVAACGDSTTPNATPIDASIDTSTADPACAACTANQICVQKFNGTCGRFATECQPRDPACTGTTCSSACDLAHCRDRGDAGLLTCAAAGCAGEDPAALHCYGP